jgi:hypothetical protein
MNLRGGRCHIEKLDNWATSQGACFDEEIAGVRARFEKAFFKKEGESR